jgi:hypothetical protein
LLLGALALRCAAPPDLPPVAAPRRGAAGLGDPGWSSGGILTVSRVRHTATLLSDGRILLAGGDALGVSELYDPRAGTFAATGALTTPRYGATATLLPDGKVLVAGGGGDQDAIPAGASAEIYDPGSGTFTATGSMTQPRALHTATLLPSGRVLLAGGVSPNWGVTAAEVYDPKTGTFTPTGKMARARADHTAVALASGRVLILAGTGDPYVELYDPAKGTFAPTGTLMHPGRSSPSATLLPSGKVLVAGGEEDDNTGPWPAELYDPAAGTFTAVGTPTQARTGHGATLLPSGLVLLAGGGTHATDPGTDGTATADLFDPIANTFSAAPAMAGARRAHRATLLPSGKVLITGGHASTPLQTAEVYDPRPGALSARTLVEPRRYHTATALPSGQVLLAGGERNGTALATVDLYDPPTGSFRTVGAMATARKQHAAALLPGGKVLLSGGFDGTGVLATAEVCDPVAKTVTPTGSMGTPLRLHTATLLPPPYDKVLVAGGESGGTTSGHATMLYDPVAGVFDESLYSLLAARVNHTATLLASGQVLLAAGATVKGVQDQLAELYDPATGFSFPVPTVAHFGTATATLLSSGHVLLAGGTNTLLGPDNAAADVYDPQTGAFSPATPLQVPRHGHAAALLPGGKVLLVGGDTPTAGNTAELYDPQTNGFSPTHVPMHHARIGHTATTLAATGQVLIAGGSLDAELYDPASDTFIALPIPAPFRVSGTTTLLPSGKLLLTGGSPAPEDVALYDPATTTSTSAGPLAVPRAGHTATLLRTGMVLLVGGSADPSALQLGGAAHTTATAELFDPATGKSAPTGPLARPRAGHTAIYLPSGKVLVVGGLHDQGAVAEVELYDPAQGSFSPAGVLFAPRGWHAATLLPSGKVLIAGGHDDKGAVSPPELFDPVEGKSTPAQGPALPGRAWSTALASGDVLAVADGAAYRYATATGTFEALAGAPASAQAAIPLWSGDALVCAKGGCALFDAATGSFGAPAPAVLGDSGAELSTLPSGDALVVSAIVLGYETLPAGVVRPVLTGAPATLTPGESVVLAGQRFTRLSARGSDAAPPTTGTAPLVFFMPSSGGGPIFGEVTDWTDGSLTWLVPRGAHVGPGWLHVMVDAVPSVGRFAVLEASSKAAPCASDGECASGYCTEGVCCDERCSGVCRSCLASLQGKGGKDGACSPIAVGTDPKNGCDMDPAGTCGRDGTCDGDGACARDPDRTPCGEDGLCMAGVCAVPDAPCRSNLDCPGRVCGVSGHCEAITAPPPPQDIGGCAVARAPGAPPARPWVAAAALAMALLVCRVVRQGRGRAAARASSALSLLGALLLVEVPARAQPARPSDAALAEAKSLFRQGVALFEAGDVERALDFFQRSRALVASGRNTTNAAVCLDRLGRHDEALEMFEELFTRHLSDLSESDRATVAPTMRALRGKVGALSITASAEGAAVHVDGRARGRLPLAGPLRVNAGSHRVRVLKDGYEVYEAGVDVPAGGSATIDAKLRVLARRGQLRVEDPASQGSEVTVDGLVVGTSPWEGTLAPGRYAVWTQNGDVGAPPAQVVVLEGQVALLRVRSGPLGAALRIEADPRSAEITVDDIVVGKGSWQGRLAPGRHQVRVGEAGYRTRAEAVLVPQPGAPPLRRAVPLEIDPTHPRWPRAPSGRFWVGAFGGYAFGPTLRSTAEARCPSACSADPSAGGVLAGLRAGYRFPLGISIDLSVGYLSVATAFTRADHRTFQTGSETHPITYELSDHLRLHGFFVGVGASYRRALAKPLGLVARTTTGVLLAAADDAIRATATAGGDRVDVAVVGASAAPRSAPLVVWPEIGLDLAWSALRVGATFGVAFSPLDGPDFEARQLWVLGVSSKPSNHGSASNAKKMALPQSGSERAYGPFLLWTPQVSAAYEF